MIVVLCILCWTRDSHTNPLFHSTLTDYGQEAFLAKAKKPPTTEKIEYLEDSELLNGRLAMIGFMGMFAQSMVTDNGFPYM